MNERKRLNRQAIIVLFLLILQYLLGMAADLFVSFPENEEPGLLWQFSWSQPFLALHIIIGLGMLIGALMFFIRAIRAQDRTWKLFSGIGLLGILLAVWGGASFIPSQNDLFSYTMASAFAVSIIAYGWGLYRANKDAQGIETP